MLQEIEYSVAGKKIKRSSKYNKTVAVNIHKP